MALLVVALRWGDYLEPVPRAGASWDRVGEEELSTETAHSTILGKPREGNSGCRVTVLRLAGLNR